MVLILLCIKIKPRSKDVIIVERAGKSCAAFVVQKKHHFPTLRKRKLAFVNLAKEFLRGSTNMTLLQLLK